MKKITGKVVSLVLALALVVTSFSATFAFAASKTVGGTVDINDDTDELYLVNGGTGATKEVANAIHLGDLVTTDRSETLADPEISSISHASGDSLLRWKINDDGEVTLTLKDTGKSGTEVLSVLAKGTYTDDDDNKITVKAKKNVTIHVLDADGYVIGKKDSGYDHAGDGIDELDTFAQTAGYEQEMVVYKPVVTSNALANYDVVPAANIVFTDDTGYKNLTANDLKDKTVVDISNSSNIHHDLGSDGTIALIAGKKSNANFTDDATTGNVTITATHYKADTGKKDDDSKTTFKGKIEKKVDVATLLTSMKSNATTFTIGKADKGGSTLLKNVYNANLPADKADDEVVVTGAEVSFPTGTTNVSVEDKSNVKKISGTVGHLTIGDASVDGVDVKGAVVVSGDKAVVGDITTKTDGTNAGLQISSGKVGNIVVKDSGVTISGGTTGTIETKKDKNSAGLITIEPDDDDVAISTQAIKAKAGLYVKSDDSAKVSVGDVTLTGDNTEVTLVGNNVTVKSVNFDYYTSKLTLGDDDAFTGTVSSLKNGDNTALTTQEDDTDATVGGDVKLDSVSVSDNTTLTFTGKVNVGDIDGDGTLRVASNKLYIDGSASGVKLALTDPQITNGMVAYTAKADAVDTEDMNNYGFTVAKSAGNSIDTFKINSLIFAGLQVSKSSARIAKDYSESFVASAYPTGTAIPANAKVEWSLDGNEDVFQVTASGNTATVKVLKVDPDFASENTATLTAKLVDADGDEIDDYAPTKIALTAIAVPDAVSDTTKDITVNGSYTFKITSPTAPTFSIGSAGVFSSALVSKNGNDYFYKITATGKVGAKAGIYLNGTKLLVATVGAPAFKSDTTSNVTVKGAYTYKITAAAVPTFSIGTAGVFTAQFVSKSGNDYFYKITSVGKTGANAGVYVNGVKVNVATVG